MVKKFEQQFLWLEQGLLWKFGQFCGELNADNDKNKQLKKVVDFFLTLEKVNLNDYLDIKDNPAYKIYLELLGDVNNIEEIEYGGHTYANIFLMYIVNLEDPEKRKFALECLLGLHREYVKGDVSRGGFAHESRSNSLMPAMNAMMIGSLRDDVKKFLFDNHLVNDTLPLSKLIVDDRDSETQNNVYDMIELYASEKFKDRHLLILRDLLIDKDVNEKCRDNFEVLWENNELAALMIVDHILDHEYDNELTAQLRKIVVRTIILLKDNDWGEEAEMFFRSLTTGWDQRLSKALCSILFWHQTKLSINYVDISLSQIKVLFAALRDNKTVTSLDLRLNQIRAGGVKYIAEALEQNKTLTLLDLGCNNIGEEGAKYIANVLRKNRTLIELSLYNNNIAAKGAETIVNVLDTNETLISLNLGYNNIGDEGAKYVAKLLETNKTLTKLTLRENNIGDKGAEIISKVLATNGTVTSFSLRGNNIGDEGAKDIAEALNKNKTLTSLYLSFNQIGSEGAKAIASALKINKTLTSLDLGYNIIGSEGIKNIAEALRANKTLTTLCLNINNIVDEGAKDIAEALRANKTLTTLCLNMNNIVNEGAKAIVSALKDNKSLTGLYLKYNHISKEIISSILDVVLSDKKRTAPFKSDLFTEKQQQQVNDHIVENINVEATQTIISLINFDLVNNNTGDERVQSITQVLEDNKTLTNLDLSGNNIGVKGVRIIAKVLKINKTLTSLNLGFNDIGEEGVSAIFDAILSDKERIAPFKCDIFSKEQQLQVNDNIAKNRDQKQISFVEKLIEETINIRESVLLW